MASLNDILQHIGGFGRFQQPVYALLNFLTITQCCQTFILVFISDKPQWVCSEQERSLLDLKTSQQGYPCYKNGSICQNITFNAKYSSITTEWKLVCNEEYMMNVGQTVILVGGLVGAVLLGSMGDRYGRRFAVILTQWLAAVFCLCSGFAQSYNQFVFWRFLAQAFLSCGGMTIFVLISEIVGPGSRDLLLTLHAGFYSIGFVVLALSSYFISDWRTLSLFISLPPVFCAVFFLHSTVCESPQWLLEKGRIEEVKQLLKDMAKKNGTEITDKYLDELSKSTKKEDQADPQNHKSISAMPRYLKLTILSCTWFIVGLLYNALSYSSKTTSSNKYISFSLSGLVEIPSLLISMFFMKSGRKMPIIYLVISSACACFLCSFLLGGEKLEYGFIITLLVMIGKFGIAASFSILYIFSAELFPATVRNTSIGICSMASRAGGALTPLILYLELYDKRIPMFLFGVAAVTSAILITTLPESLGDILKKKKVE